MLGGLLVHASPFQEQRPLFDAISFVSAHFRMGVFMAISGLLSGLALNKQDVWNWVQSRATRLSLPMISGLAITCPTMAILNSLQPFGPGPAFPVIDWHHIWFLYALILYLPLAWGLLILDRRIGIFDRLEALEWKAHQLQCLLLVPTIACSFALMWTSVSVAHGETPSLLIGGIQAHFLAGYAPIFLMSLVVGRAGKICSAV